VCARSLWPVLLLGLFYSAPYASGQANPPIYSEIIPTSSGLPYNPANDVRGTFVAPNGKTVEVLVKGPIGSGTYSRAIKPGETADEYFPAVVAEAVRAGASSGDSETRLRVSRTHAVHGPEIFRLQSAGKQQRQSVLELRRIGRSGNIGKTKSRFPTSVSDLDIDFSGSELDFKAPVIGIWILEAQRLRLRNLTIDWPALPIASLGTIVKDPLHHGHNALVIDNKYPVMDNYQGGPVAIQAVDR
jgi:hypothetical protein